MPFIGDVHIVYPTEEGGTQDRSTTEQDFVDHKQHVAEFERHLENGDIPFFLTVDGHARGESLDEQYEAMRSLAGREAAENPFEFLEKRGHLSIESASYPRQPRDNVREGTVTVRYLPDALYQTYVKQDDSQVSNDFGIEFYGTFALPSIAENVRLRNWEEPSSIPLNPVTTRVDESSTRQNSDTATENGNIRFYSATQFINAPDAATADGTDQYDTTAYGFQTHRLDASGENVSEDVTVPDGNYTIKVRAKASTSGDEISINGTTHSIDSTSFTTVEETGVAASSESISPDVAWVSGSVDVDYILVEPEYRIQVLFDLPSGTNYSGVSYELPEYCADDVQTVKVYDTMGSSTESDWERVYDEGHSFVGNIVVRNGLISANLSENRADMEANVNDSYLNFTTFNPRNDSDSTWINGHDIKGSRIVEMTHAKCVFEFWYDKDDVSEVQTMTVTRDSPIIELDAHVNWLFLSDGREINTRRFISEDVVVQDATSDQRDSIPTGANSVISYDERQDVVRSVSLSDDAVRFSGVNMSSNIFIIPDSSPYQFTVYISAVPFDSTANLFSEAEDAEFSSNAVVNHWEMPLGVSGNLDEFSGGGMAQFTEDTANSQIIHSNDGYDYILLNSLQWGTSQAPDHYHLEFQASDTADKEVVYFRYGNQGSSTVSDEYLIGIKFSSDSIILSKWVGGSSINVGSTAVTLSYNTHYHMELEWDPSTGSHDVYIWQDGNGKPGTPTASYTDSEYSDGYVGFGAYGSVDILGLSVDAEETTSSGNSAVIVPNEAAVGVTNSNDKAEYNVVLGTDIPLGTYVCAVRLKQTNSSAGWLHQQRNASDGGNLGIGGNAQPSIGTSYEFNTRTSVLNKDDYGDTYESRIHEADTVNVSHAAIDEFILFPVSLLRGGNTIGPQDAAFMAMTDAQAEKGLLHRRKL